MYLVAFAISYFFFVYQIRKRKLEISQDDIINFFFWVIIGLLIGARLFATLLFDSSGYYWRNPHRIFWPFDDQFHFIGLAGMNYYGGLLGAVVAGILYCRRKRIDTVEWADMLAGGIPLGYTFGRFGNFINGELYGRITKLPWGMIFPHAQTFPASEPWVQSYAADIGLPVTPEAVSVNLPRHPTQIYEAIFDGLLIWAIIWFLVRKRRPYPGFTIGFYVVAYGFVRFVIDYLRMPLTGDFLFKLSSKPNPPYEFVSIWNFIPSQLYSLLMVLGGVLFLVFIKRFYRPPTPREEAKKKPPSSRRLRKRIDRSK
jgi:phosphatidylglycerol:prolipoprotein diacylglycerol transferase